MAETNLDFQKIVERLIEASASNVLKPQGGQIAHTLTVSPRGIRVVTRERTARTGRQQAARTDNTVYWSELSNNRTNPLLEMMAENASDLEDEIARHPSEDH